MSLLGAMDNTLYLLGGLIALVLMAVGLLRRAQSRGVSARDVTREQRARLREQRDVQQSMDELLTQLEEVSRRINAQAETQLAKLTAAIEAADARLARLERPLTIRSAARAVATAGRATPPPAPLPPPPVAAPDAPGPPESAPSAAESPPTMTPQPPTPSSESRDARRQRIYELADAGTTPITIADTLQVPLGEVELVLNLRRFGRELAV